MRKFIALFFAASLFGANAYAVEPQTLDESTNPNANPDVKTQNMQQKPNKHKTDSQDDHDQSYRQPRSTNSGGDMNSNTDDSGTSRTYR